LRRWKPSRKWADYSAFSAATPQSNVNNKRIAIRRIDEGKRGVNVVIGLVAAKSACSKGLTLTRVPPGKTADVQIALASSLGWRDTKRSVGADNRRFGSSPARNPGILLASAWLLMPAFWSVESQTATAQNTAEPASAGLEEIVVTARRREESIQDTPISIEAFTAQNLQDRNVFNVYDLAKFTPNLEMSASSENSGASFAPQIYIRGVGQQEYLATSDPGVGVYIDGVYIARSVGQSPDVVDFDHIEVLRGPQGTLFGKNTIGGAINMVSKSPSQEPGGYIEATGGNFSRKDFKASVEGPLGSSELLGKLAIATLNQDGYINRITNGQTLGGMDSSLFRGMVVWAPTNKLSITFIADDTHSSGDSSAGNLVAVTQTGLLPLWNALVGGPAGHTITAASVPCNPYVEHGVYPNVNELDLWGASITVEWKASPVAIKSITAERAYRAVYGNDADHTPFDYTTTLDTDHQHQFSEEIQFSGDALHLKWIGGLFYFDEHWTDLNTVTVANGLYQALESLPGAVVPLAPYPIGPNSLPLFMCPAVPVGFPCAGGPGNPFNVSLDIDFNINDAVDDKSYAAFTQSTYDFTDRWSMTAGIRFTHDEKSFTIDQIRVPSGVPVVALTTFANDWSAFTPRYDLDYKVTPDDLLYFSASRGYKEGGFNGRPTAPGEVNSFGPEYVWTYELGSKNEWDEHRLRSNVDIFLMNYTNIQLTSVEAGPDETVLQVVDNAGNAKIKGAELDIAARPVPALELNLSGGYLDARYTELNPGVTYVTLSSQFMKTPRWSGTAGAQYLWNLFNRSSINARVDYSYSSRTYNDLENTPVLVQGGYGVLGARTTWHSANRKWMVAIFGANLTNKTVIESADSALSSLGLADADYGPPRQYGASLRYSF
jgi:iron complex outermembrane recepter protein